MAKDKEPDPGRLCQAAQRARQALRYYRECRRHAVRQYVGDNFSEEGSREEIPINLLSLYIQIVGRSMMAKNPRVMLSTFNRQHKPIVSTMQRWANRQLDQMRFDATMRRLILDALFSIGIMKVALATPADSARVGWVMPAAMPFAEVVDLDDFVVDMHAHSFEHVGFIGHRYRVPLDAVKDSKVYGKGRRELEPSQDQAYNVEGDERVNMIGRTMYLQDDQEFEDSVDLWEIYLPRHRLVYTFADNQMSGPAPYEDRRARGDSMEPLRVQRWIGPDSGPYHLFGLQDVPGNLMPKGPIMDLLPLHDFANQSYRKIMRQTARQKEIIVVAGGAMEDGSRTQLANDGDIIRSDNPERTKVVTYGGMSQQVMAAFVDSIQRFSYQAGNLDMAGGLSPQSKTLGQDKMLEENASHTVAGMQDMTVAFTSKVVKALCWFWHHDPARMMKSVHILPGAPELSVQQTASPQQRQQVPFEDLDIAVDPYSLQAATPQSRMAALQQVVQQTIVPMMQLLQQHNIAFDVSAYLQKMAEYLNMPDLADIITMMPAPDPTGGGGGGGEAPGMPAQTERTYNRVSTPGRTPAGDDRNKVNALMGINPGGNRNTANNPNGAVQ